MKKIFIFIIVTIIACFISIAIAAYLFVSGRIIITHNNYDDSNYTNNDFNDNYIENGCFDITTDDIRLVYFGNNALSKCKSYDKSSEISLYDKNDNKIINIKSDSAANVIEANGSNCTINNYDDIKISCSQLSGNDYTISQDDDYFTIRKNGAIFINISDDHFNVNQAGCKIYSGEHGLKINNMKLNNDDDIVKIGIGGIHIKDNDGNAVNIGINGINIKSHNGERVILTPQITMLTLAKVIAILQLTMA